MAPSLKDWSKLATKELKDRPLDSLTWRTPEGFDVKPLYTAADLEGFEAALIRKKRATSPTPKLLDGAAEAKLIATRLGKPPAGFGHWTLRLLADQMVELEIVESISPETVRQTLKKTA